MAEPERVVALSKEVGKVAAEKIAQINQITSETRTLALNAMIEAARAGAAGRGFAVVAQEVKDVSERVTKIAQELSTGLAGSIGELTALGEIMVRQMRGQRMSDLALNMIEIIDRNLYERSCDVRWWATDAAVIEALTENNPAATDFACKRLGVILNSYTVYLDLWIADAAGRVIGNGRPERFGSVIGTDVSGQAWFKDAMRTRSGEDYVACDIDTNRQLNGAEVATYSTAIRRGGAVNGEALGVLGIFFDWRPQAAAVVKGVRLSEDERRRTRCLLIDGKHRVIAASDDRDVLKVVFPLRTNDGPVGHYSTPTGTQIGYALTPGYETYRGLGWYGVIEQDPPAA